MSFVFHLHNGAAVFPDYQTKYDVSDNRHNGSASAALMKQYLYKTWTKIQIEPADQSPLTSRRWPHCLLAFKLTPADLSLCGSGGVESEGSGVAPAKNNRRGQRLIGANDRTIVGIAFPLFFFFFIIRAKRWCGDFRGYDATLATR